jgi:hypothetical protein
VTISNSLFVLSLSLSISVSSAEEAAAAALANEQRQMQQYYTAVDSNNRVRTTARLFSMSMLNDSYAHMQAYGYESGDDGEFGGETKARGDEHDADDDDFADPFERGAKQVEQARLDDIDDLSQPPSKRARTDDIAADDVATNVSLNDVDIDDADNPYKMMLVRYAPLFVCVIAPYVYVMHSLRWWRRLQWYVGKRERREDRDDDW